MNFNLKSRTCYLIISGSHSYGGQNQWSDYDLRGWCIPPREYFHTFDKKFEQSDRDFSYFEYPFSTKLHEYCLTNNFRLPDGDEKIDHCIYDIRKFFRLAADCNPNLIENLFVDDNEVLICNKWAQKVRDNRHLFLSARAKHTFLGYSISQLKRINTHRRWLLNPREKQPQRKDYGLPETNVIPGDHRGAAEKLITSKVREWLLQDAEIMGRTELALFHDKLKDFVAAILSEKDLVVSFTDEQKLFDAARLVAMKQLGMTENYISVLQAEKKYRSASNEWQQYQQWKKTRNPDRAKLEAKFGYDCKHGSQLIRLLVLGKELLTTGKITVKRDDRDFFLDVKRGKWSYEKIIKYLEEAEAAFTDIYKNKKYVVPHNPPINKLSALCQEIVEEALEEWK